MYKVGLGWRGLSGETELRKILSSRPIWCLNKVEITGSTSVITQWHIHGNLIRKCIEAAT